MLDALCVARIALSADRIPNLIEALQSSFEKFLSAREALIKNIEEQEASNADSNH